MLPGILFTFLVYKILLDIILIHYSGDIVLIGPDEQEVATTLDLLVKNLCAKGRKINMIKIKGPYTLVKFLGTNSIRHVEIFLLW